MADNSHVLRALDANVRFDGRKNDEYRKITIETGISQTAEGSARVSLGDTVVVAGVKMSLGTPYGDTPEQGVLVVDCELLPLSSPLFESGPPGIDAIELARVTDRGVRESHAINLDKLCVKKGEKVWFVSCDIATMNADGNLFDAASLAVMAAIKSVTFPSVDEDGNVDYKKKTKEKLPLEQVPIGVTVWKVGDTLVIDPTQAEENVFDARLTITTIEDGSIVAMQKGGEGTLTIDQVNRMIDLASSKVKELRKHL